MRSFRIETIGHLGLLPTITVSVVLAVLLFVPSSAGAHHIAGATYTGDIAGGGTVTFSTHPEGYHLLHPDVQLEDETGTFCEPTDDRCALEFLNVPICGGQLLQATVDQDFIRTGAGFYGTHGFLSLPVGEGDFDWTGTFASPNGAYGTLTYRFCGSHTVSWEATTDSTNPPWVDPCPNPECDFGSEDPSNPDDGSSTGQRYSCAGKRATIVGSDGPEKIKGTKRRDVIVANGGNDVVKGLAGNDVICGGSGKDELNGGKGNDTLLGQKGKDKLKGGPGKDKQIQ